MSYKKTAYSRNLFILLKEAFVEMYNNLGYTLLSSFLWVLVTMPFATFLFTTLQVELERENPFGLLFMFAFILLPYGALILAPVNSALFYLIKQASEGWANLRGLWVGLRKYYRRAAGVYAVYFALLLFLLLDMIICFFILTPLFAKIIGIILLYLFIFLLISNAYFLPLIVLQENNWKKVLKKAFLLTLDNGPFTLFAGIITLVLGILFSFFLPLLVLTYGGFLYFYRLKMFYGVMAKYEGHIAADNSLDGEKS